MPMKVLNVQINLFFPSLPNLFLHIKLLSKLSCYHNVRK